MPSSKLEKQTAEQLLNIHLQQTYKDKVGMLSKKLFADGKSYFIDRKTGMTPAQPAVVHVDVMDGFIAKKRLLKRKGLWIINDATESCPILDDLTKSALALTNEEATGIVASKAKLTIKLFAYNRVNSLHRCLNALRNAYYDGDSVNLQIFIDFDEISTEFPPVVLQTAETFLWPHGSKEIIYRTSHAHIRQQWLESWYPSADSFHSNEIEFAIFVEDDVEVSMFYYRWAKLAIKNYYLSPDSNPTRLMGISLQKIWLDFTNYPARFDKKIKDHGKSLLYQVPSTWGVIMSPSHWRTFRQWYDLQIRKNRLMQNDTGNPHHVLQPFLPGNLLSNVWYKQSQGKMFLPWLIKFAYEMGWYFLYPNLPTKSLIINHQEPGAFNEESLGLDSLLLYNENEVGSSRNLYEMHQLKDLDLYDICGQLSTPAKLDENKQLGQVICVKHEEPP